MYTYNMLEFPLGGSGTSFDCLVPIFTHSGETKESGRLCRLHPQWGSKANSWQRGISKEVQVSLRRQSFDLLPWKWSAEVFSPKVTIWNQRLTGRRQDTQGIFLVAMPSLSPLYCLRSGSSTTEPKEAHTGTRDREGLMGSIVPKAHTIFNC